MQKKHVLYCATALTIFLLGMVMISDLFLRTQDIPGTDPDGWDAAGSVALGLLGAMLILSWLKGDD